MEYRWFDFALCALIFCTALYGWGRFKQAVATRELRKAEDALRKTDYREAVRICQAIAPDMQRDSEYWYVLAVALAGAGSSADARTALEKLLAIRPDHPKGLALLDTLPAQDEA